MPRKQAQQHGSSTESTRGVSPPSGTITIQPLDVVANPRKRKVSALTPDNADIVLSSCLDISRLIERLNEEQEIFLDANKEALIAVMKQCVKDPKSVGFSSVTQRHLDFLGLDVILDLELDHSLVEKLNRVNSSPNKMIHKDYFDKHFNVSKESGCRSIIHQYLVAAVVYAQGIIDKDPKIMESISNRFGVKDPQLAVFAELPIPPTRITHNDTFYDFHGFLDYGIDLIKGRDVSSLHRGSLRLNPAKMLIGILEAKSLTEMQNAESQISVQVLTILTLTGRKYFTDALTNGALWRFYVARLGNDQLDVFSSAELATDTDQGLIVELLKDMARAGIYDSRLGRSFT